jgi:hypothetical protein
MHLVLVYSNSAKIGVPITSQRILWTQYDQMLSKNLWRQKLKVYRQQKMGNKTNKRQRIWHNTNILSELEGTNKASPKSLNNVVAILATISSLADRSCTRFYLRVTRPSNFNMWWLHNETSVQSCLRSLDSSCGLLHCVDSWFVDTQSNDYNCHPWRHNTDMP